MSLANLLVQPIEEIVGFEFVNEINIENALVL